MSHRAIGQQFDPEGKPGFEDGGQGYLWPYKMPDSGTTRGVEGMHLYRGVELTRGYDDPHEALDALVNAPARTALRDGVGHREPGATLGRHWTHDKDYAGWLADGEGAVDDKGRYTGVIIEAEHPGHEHVLDWDKDREEASATIIPEQVREKAQPEVPIRGGAPMRVRAIHLPKGTGWQRHEVDHRSKA